MTAALFQTSRKKLNLNFRKRLAAETDVTLQLMGKNLENKPYYLKNDNYF